MKGQNLCLGLQRIFLFDLSLIWVIENTIFNDSELTLNVFLFLSYIHDKFFFTELNFLHYIVL